MTNTQTTKTLLKLNNQPSNYSLGFNRFSVLPLRVRTYVNLACYIETENINTHNSIVSFFDVMTNEEYITYLKSA